MLKNYNRVLEDIGQVRKSILNLNYGKQHNRICMDTSLITSVWVREISDPKNPVAPQHPHV